MAEVLSQSQIDALLNSMLSGDGGKEQTEAELNEKKYRKYNFRDPRKFTKDRIKMLNGIFDNYTRLVSTRLNAFLHTNCSISVESVEEQRYYEFSNALTEYDILSLVNAEIKGKQEELPIMFHLSTSIALSMIDSLLGGEGEMDDSIGSDYNYTDLEVQLYETIMQDIVPSLSRSWENYLDISFTYQKTETNPTLVQLIGIDEIVVIVGLNMEFPSGSGQMSICLPGEVLTNIFAEINSDTPGRLTTSEDNSKEILDSLRESSLEIKACVGGGDMSLRDLYHLNVGDVIDFGCPKNTPIYLEIGGYNWFSGRMGAYKKNMAIKIDDICYQAEERSE